MESKIKIRKRPTLKEVMSFDDSDVVYRFQKTYGVSKLESEDIFNQVKKFLWLANERRFDGLETGLSIDHPLVVIDEMWHNFILFTTTYSKFCVRFFGYYIHHAPAKEKEEYDYRQTLSQIPPKERRNYKMEKKRPQYEYIYDKLGQSTFSKWYFEYPSKFSYRKLVEKQFKNLENMVLFEPPKSQQIKKTGEQT